MLTKSHPGYTVRYSEADILQRIIYDGQRENALLENNEVLINSISWDDRERVLSIDVEVFTRSHS